MTNLSAKGFIAATVLPFSCLVLFYSLAIHMYLALGEWPATIGNHGFSAALNAHASFQFWWLGVVVQASIYLWPVAFVLSLAIPHARFIARYLILYAVAALLCFFLMMALAPPQFLNWWID
jgi:hypothetical protein